MRPTMRLPELRPSGQCSAHGRFRLARDSIMCRQIRKIKSSMTAEDQNDYERFLEGITFFLRLAPKQVMEHLKLHKEDAFSQIRHFSGQGSALCTRDGMNHLRLLVRRRIQVLSNGKDFDYQEVVREIAEHIGPTLKAGVETGEDAEDIFERVLVSAFRTVQDQQKKSIYYYPCVLAGAKSPEEFSVGPVKFTVASLFESRLSSLSPTKMQFDENVRNDEFINYIRQFGWIASVNVPPCSPEISKNRAELAARTAINIVRVWFGLGHGRRMRLVHTEPATSRFSKYLIEADNKISLSWSRTAEGAPVVDGWFDQVDVEHHKLASWLLRDIVFDERMEITERLIDALSWFGDAAFEPSPGAKIAKLVMLLERLTTTTRKFSKKRFCRRVAILAMNDDADFAAKYWTAYEFYNARSAIAHGSSSQSSSEHWVALREAQPLITNSIFRAMEVYSLVKFGRRPSLPRSLQAFFDQQENRRSSLAGVLDIELAAKDRQRGF
jgi:hypothetical protein